MRIDIDNVHVRKDRKHEDCDWFDDSDFECTNWRDFPPIMIASNTVDDGSEPNCADTRSVLHLLNELADNNPNEEKHWYLKKMLDKAWTQYHELIEENEQLKDALNQRTEQYDKYYKENEQLKQRLKEYQQELYCKDRVLENKGIDIECCDKYNEKQSCGYCKHFQLDGMFGIWCDIHDADWRIYDSDCPDFERNR